MNYYNIPSPPEIVSATNIISRLIDGLAFRYRWATEDLTENEIAFRPCDSSMNMLELLQHIHHLAYVTDCVINGQIIEKQSFPDSFHLLRQATLDLYEKNSKELLLMQDSALDKCKFQPKNKATTFPFWNLINGPVADALTHVGQITSWRRIAGNPIPRVDPFLGKPLN